MNIEFDRSFLKFLSKLQEPQIRSKIITTITEFESVNSIAEITNCKKLKGFKNYYRKRIGDYRIGFEKVNESTIRLIIVSHRKDIYNNFP